MPTLKDILHATATKANEEKKNKETFLIRLLEQITNAAKEGNFRITLTRRYYPSSYNILVVMPETVFVEDVKEFFKDSGMSFRIYYYGNGGEEIDIDWGN